MAYYGHGVNATFDEEEQSITIRVGRDEVTGWPEDFERLMDEELPEEHTNRYFVPTYLDLADDIGVTDARSDALYDIRFRRMDGDYHAINVSHEQLRDIISDAREEFEDDDARSKDEMDMVYGYASDNWFGIRGTAVDNEGERYDQHLTFFSNGEAVAGGYINNIVRHLRDAEYFDDPRPDV